MTLDLLVERWSMREAGALLSMGDMGGQESDTTRILKFKGLGYGATTASRTEVQAGSRSALTTDYADITTGRRYWGMGQSYLDMVLGSRARKADLFGAAEQLADVFEGMFMDMLASTVAGAAADLGTSTQKLSFDDMIDMVTYFELLDGFEGMLFGLLHGGQTRDLGDSLRAEPAYQVPEVTSEALRLHGPGYWGNLLGINLFKSNKITGSGSAYQGGVWHPSAMGWQVAGTQNILDAVTNPAQSLVVPELGMVAEMASVGNTAQSGLDVNFFVGMGITYTELLRGLVTKSR